MGALGTDRNFRPRRGPQNLRKLNIFNDHTMCDHEQTTQQYSNETDIITYELYKMSQSLHHYQYIKSKVNQTKP